MTQVDCKQSRLLQIPQYLSASQRASAKPCKLSAFLLSEAANVPVDQILTCFLMLPLAKSDETLVFFGDYFRLDNSYKHDRVPVYLSKGKNFIRFTFFKYAFSADPNFHFSSPSVGNLEILKIIAQLSIVFPTLPVEVLSVLQTNLYRFKSLSSKYLTFTITPSGNVCSV